MPKLPPVVNDGIFPAVRTAINSGFSVLSSTERLDLLRNGAFQFWQRGTSFALNTPQYTADGWVIKHVATTPATGTVTRQTFTMGQAAVPQDPGAWMRVTNTSTGSYAATSFAALDSPVARVRMCGGEKMTVSFWARSSITRGIGVSILQSFGTGGSPFTATVGQTAILTPTWAEYVFTFDIPSTAGKTLGTDHAIVLRFMLAGGASAPGAPAAPVTWGGTGDTDFALVKLEKGENASPFVFPDGEGKTAQEDYCRMFYQVYNFLVSLNTVNAGVYYIPLLYSPLMARTPTVTPTIVNGSFSSIGTFGNNANAITLNATATATNAANFIHINAILSAEIW